MTKHVEKIIITLLYIIFQIYFLICELLSFVFYEQHVRNIYYRKGVRHDLLLIIIFMLSLAANHQTRYI